MGTARRARGSPQNGRIDEQLRELRIRLSRVLTPGEMATFRGALRDCLDHMLPRLIHAYSARASKAEGQRARRPPKPEPAVVRPRSGAVRSKQSALQLVGPRVLRKACQECGRPARAGESLCYVCAYGSD